jgi:hypothetical protein
MRPIILHPKARKVIRRFPKEVRTRLGRGLFRLQLGEQIGMPNCRPMPEVAAGVSEIRVKARMAVSARSTTRPHRGASSFSRLRLGRQIPKQLRHRFQSTGGGAHTDDQSRHEFAVPPLWRRSRISATRFGTLVGALRVFSHIGHFCPMPRLGLDLSILLRAEMCRQYQCCAKTVCGRTIPTNEFALLTPIISPGSLPGKQ